MTQFTIGGEPGCCMVRVGCPVVVSHMASGTGIGCAVIIAIVAGIAIDGNMVAGKWPVIVMYRECGRLPAGIGSMTRLAIGSDTDGGMGWIRSLVVIIDMAAGTGIWCGIIVACMAGITIDGSVGSRQGIIVTMDRESCRLPSRIRCVAGLTVGRDAYGGMIWICSLIKGSFMAGKTNGRCSNPTVCMAA